MGTCRELRCVLSLSPLVLLADGGRHRVDVVIPWAVSLKIVFNGAEYDSVDAMPPDVRKQYEVALETLRKSGGEEILSVLQRDMGVTGAHIKATFREIVVNGKKYDSVDAMPPDVRRTYEQAMARVRPSWAP